MKKKHIQYWVYFFSTAIVFFWLGSPCGAGLAYHSAEKQSEKYRVKMVKDSLYFKYTQNLSNSK